MRPYVTGPRSWCRTSQVSELLSSYFIFIGNEWGKTAVKNRMSESKREGVCLPRLQRTWCSFNALYLDNISLRLWPARSYLWGISEVGCVWQLFSCKTVWHQQHLPPFPVGVCAAEFSSLVFITFQVRSSSSSSSSFPLKSLCTCWHADTFLRCCPRPQGTGLTLLGFRRAPGKRQTTGDCLGCKSLSGKERWGWGQRERGNCPGAWAEPQNISISANIEAENASALKRLVLAGPLGRINSSSRTENCLLKGEELTSCTMWLHHMVLGCTGWLKGLLDTVVI